MTQQYGIRSLRFKLILASTLVEVLLLTLLVANGVRLMNNSLAEQTRIRLDELAPLFNASLAPPLAERDYATLQDLLEAIVQAKGLHYIQVLDHRGERVARAGDVPATFAADASLRAVAGEHVFDQERPLGLFGQRLGRVQFGISTAPMEAAKAAIFNQGIGIALLEISATFLLLTLLGVFLTRNLLTLAEGARTVAAGDLDTVLTVTTHDEIGATAAAFNRMVQSLKTSMQEREQAMEALRQSEQNFRAQAENAHDGILITVGEHGTHAFANRRLAEMLGYAALDQLLARSIDDLLPAAERAEVMARFRRRSLADPRQYETGLVRRDGTILPVELSIGDTVWHGAPAVMVIVRDITERKRAEAERESMLAELTAKNAEMENFVYTISHDLKTPLITIGGFAGMLEKDIERNNREDVRGDLAEIRRATSHMQALIDDLLALSRTGRIVGPRVPTDLGVLARDIEGRLTEAIERSDARLRLAADLPQVIVDPMRFAQVLENLIGNAIKYRRRDVRPEVTVGWLKRGGELLLYVRDNGRGIAPAYLERIFALFERIDADTEGTGVGLAIARRIVEVHGGRLWAESTVGEGSTFWIALPESVIVAV